MQQPAKPSWKEDFRSFIANLKLPWDSILCLQHSLQLPVKPMCILYNTHCEFSVILVFLQTIIHKNLTHAQTTYTRPSCSPNCYKSENSAWDRGINYGKCMYTISELVS